MIRRRKKTEMIRKYMILVINIAPMTKDIIYFRAKKKRVLVLFHMHSSKDENLEHSSKS